MRLTVIQGGRAKALRPLPRADRVAALDRARAAWERGDWFEAHELLEPAWMGTDDPSERDLYQGLIKLAAAYVHRARGNMSGLAKNLAGADVLLRRVVAGNAPSEGIPVRRLLIDIAARLPANGRPADPTLEPPSLTIAEEP